MVGKTTQTISIIRNRHLSVSAPLMLAAFVVGLGLLSACGGDSASSGSQGFNQTGGSQVAGINNTTTNLLMAKELIATGINPFLNKLPITADIQPDATPPEDIPTGNVDATPAITLDPFEGVSLVGIAYQPDNAYALVQVGEGSLVVRVGDAITTEGGQLKVVKISREKLELSTTGSSKKTQSFDLPDIVGFSKDNSASGAASGTASGTPSRSSKTKTSNDDGGDLGQAIKDAAAAVFESPSPKPRGRGSSNKVEEPPSQKGKKSIIKLDE